jgi:hypothetical protein
MIWFAIPSARPPEEADRHLSRWRERGYRLAIWRDHPASVSCDMELRGAYPGYYAAIDAICREILERFPQTHWIVTGGDDTDPDPAKPPAEIASECEEHFRGTLGVMQPTGDRWGERGEIPYAERVAGSPWMGAEWCRRAYRGRGPMHDSYRHFYGDEEVQCVALRLGLFWQRQDVTHYHDHYGRNRGAVPSFHRNARSLFVSDGDLFRARKAAGFPCHELK